ncbi:penicillin-binding protein, beta-lactamase class C [Burkholderia sp. Ch1-1]|uniref:Penicillin-binding protein, beta-lactamase class C n=1 Tax=Paraburkholderia dioscoreae TaxID=2604047 RepID=A0A5Q4ZCQ4_9BURK|nr:serine hydrolase domain-containing protein [Paraburkholderia dioscoreae]EIF34066.1 penicillin-binding protein, beta-lactamase class C [Burkholderia sp. Ch1-1]VVD32979.1 Penicillin-binding protein, beta-lactamase class C [Paraburkholderia dioscoreae]
MNFDGSVITALLDNAVSKGAIHGIAAVVVNRHGILFHHAAGEASPHTLFRNASMTKAVATTAALQLVEQGLLSLDATVESILPAFGQLQVLDGFDGNQPRLRPPVSKATVRQLMTHTAGLGYFFLSEKLKRYHELTGEPHPLTGLKRSLSVPLVNDPGTAWEYGTNSDWLGLIVEKLSGQSLDSYVKQHVYGPLGMKDSTFAPNPEQRCRLLRVMQRQADGTLAPSKTDLSPTSEWDAAGHGSYGTVQDYGRFLQAWLDDGAGILQPSTVEMALRDHLGSITLPDPAKPTVPELSNEVPAMPMPQGWGLGFHLTLADLPGMRSRGSADWAGIFNSYYWFDRSRDIGGVLMTQMLPFFDMPVVETLIGFEAAVYQQVGAAVPAAGMPSGGAE